MDVVVWPDWFVDEERHWLSSIEERGAILTEQHSGSVYEVRIDVPLNGVRAPVWVLARPDGAFFSVEWYSKIVPTFCQEAQRNFPLIHP